MPRNIPSTAEMISKAHVAALSAVLPKSRYPKYAITPSVTIMNMTPIGALLPVKIPAIAMTNMNTMLTPNKSPIGSMPNCLVDSGLLNDLNVFSLGVPFGIASVSHIISVASHTTEMLPAPSVVYSNVGLTMIEP